MLTATLIEEAIEFLRPRIRQTPVEPSPGLSKIAGVPVWLKLECLQITGSFKIRGAWFRMSRLTEAERRTGILTCSAGNHGKAIAYAARELGVAATICVPSSVDEAKYRGMMELGAEVRVAEFPGYDETEDWAIAEAEREGRPFLSAFDDYAVMAGSGGSLAAEIMDAVPEASTFVMPAGGGGLSAGFAFYAVNRARKSRIICCQHRESPGLSLSMKAGRAITRLPAVVTSAGGIEGGFGARPFDVIRSYIGAVAEVSEAQIEEGVRWMFDHHQYVIEPSSAAAVAAVLAYEAKMIESPAVVVLTGRNVSRKVLERILHG